MFEVGWCWWTNKLCDFPIIYVSRRMKGTVSKMDDWRTGVGLHAWEEDEYRNWFIFFFSCIRGPYPNTRQGVISAYFATTDLGHTITKAQFITGGRTQKGRG